MSEIHPTADDIARRLQVELEEAAAILDSLEEPRGVASLERYLAIRTFQANGDFAPCSLYFIEAPSAGLIKIGRTIDIRSRFAGLCASSPVPLQIIGFVRYATTAHERNLHEHFAATRRHGEWFVATRELRTLAEELTIHGPEFGPGYDDPTWGDEDRL